MKARDMALCAMLAAVLCVCAWLSVPVGDMSFSMQTFGVFLTLGVLGGKRGSIAIGVYLASGLVGLPVFTGFRGGPGVLLGATGGYITGFLAAALVYWLVTALWGRRWVLPAMVLGLLVCYGFGTAWYCLGYLPVGSAGFGAALLKCVVPYLLPDAVKLGLAYALSIKLPPLRY